MYTQEAGMGGVSVLLFKVNLVIKESQEKKSKEGRKFKKNKHRDVNKLRFRTGS